MVATYTVSPKSVRLVTREISPRYPGEHPVFHRFDLIPGADHEALANSKVLMIGCGGLGSECGHGLVRKGIGSLEMLDYDLVELSNLARQCFFREDLDRNKALCLARNLARQATGNSVIAGHAMAFQTAVEGGMDTQCTTAICAVDNNATRVYAARHYLELRTPVIFTGVEAHLIWRGASSI